MRMVCDLDGVVFDFDRAWTTRHRRQFGSQVQRLTPQGWGQVHELAGMGVDEFWEWWERSGSWSGMPTYPGAVEALRLAEAEGWDITYATNRPLPDHHTRGAILEAGLPQPENLKWVTRKWEVEGDLYLEDAPGNLVEMYRHGRAAVRVERPWNSPELYPMLEGKSSIPNLTPATLAPLLDLMYWAKN